MTARAAVGTAGHPSMILRIVWCIALFGGAVFPLSTIGLGDFVPLAFRLATPLSVKGPNATLVPFGGLPVGDDAIVPADRAAPSDGLVRPQAMLDGTAARTALRPTATADSYSLSGGGLSGGCNYDSRHVLGNAQGWPFEKPVKPSSLVDEVR
jgi:hypothetical protein